MSRRRRNRATRVKADAPRNIIAPGVSVAPAKTYTPEQMAAAMQAVSTYGNPLPRSPYDQVVPFGPGQALIPSNINPAGRSGRPEPRQYEYPVSWNLPGFSDRLVPWSILRAAADQIPLFRQCIQVRKDEIATLDWHIRVSKRAVDLATAQDPNANRQEVEQAIRERCAPHIGRLTQFWEEPDKRNGLDFIGWASKALEEHFVLDALPVYARRTIGGQPYSLEILDGTTIKPLLDQYGYRPLPPNPAFQQILQGFPRGEFIADTVDGEDGAVILDGFTSDRLSYLVHNVRANSPYGLSSVEQALIDGDLWLRRHGWLKAEYTDGVMPAGWLLAGEGQAEWTVDQLRVYERAINEYYSGITENRQRYRILPYGMTPHDGNADAGTRYKPEYDLFLLKLVVRHFDTTIAELGHTEAKGLGSTGWHEGQADIQDRAGTKPTLRRLQSWCTRLQRLYLDAPPELEFVIEGLESEDEVTQDQVAGTRVSQGRMTLNEDRDRTGLPRYTFPEADKPFILTQTGITFLEGSEAMQQQHAEMDRQLTAAKVAAAAQPPGADGEAGDGQAEAPETTAGSDAQDAQDARDAANKLDELGRYRRWVKKNRNTERPFRSEYLTLADLAKFDLDPAVDPIVPKADAEAGGADPKGETPSQSWPGWVVDLATAMLAGAAISRALTGLFTRDQVGRLVGALGDQPTEAETLHVLQESGAVQQVARALRPVLVDTYTEGWLIGDRSAQSLLTGGPVDWRTWTPGRAAAARRILAEDGRAHGLDLLLSQGDAVIKSVANSRVQELARALAAGLKDGAGTDRVTRDIRDLLSNPERARMIAQTELQRAQTVATLDRYNLAGVPGVRWLVFPDACAKCQANADVGAIPIEDTFPSGVDGPPAHPSCRCQLMPELELDAVQLLPKSDIEKWDPALHPRGPDGRFVPTLGGTRRLAKNLQRAKAAGRDVTRHEQALAKRLQYHQSQVPIDTKPAKKDVKKLLDDAAGPDENSPAQVEFREYMKALEFTDHQTGLRVHLSRTNVSSPEKGRVSFSIKDGSGKTKGKATRIWSTDEDGKLQVEHHYMVLDSDVQGAGFATRWSAHVEQFYRDHGVVKIRLWADIDVGGYAWAKAGYDWNNFDAMDSVYNDIQTMIEDSDEMVTMRELATTPLHRAALAQLIKDRGEPFTPEERAKLVALRERMTREQWDRGNAPTPLEIAMAGWSPGAKTWAGKTVMKASSFEGVRWL